jgi:hypothetical protein
VYITAASEIKPKPRSGSRFESCPHCGAAIVPERLPLTPVQRRIVDVVRRRGAISAEDLRCAVWADDEDNGPLNDKTLRVHIHLLNQRLAGYGLCVRANKGAGATYRIRKVAP